MPKPVGRPREFIGPRATMIVHVPALVHAQVSATAKARGQTMSQVIRECVAQEMKREWEVEP